MNKIKMSTVSYTDVVNTINAQDCTDSDKYNTLVTLLRALMRETTEYLNLFKETTQFHQASQDTTRQLRTNPYRPGKIETEEWYLDALDEYHLIRYRQRLHKQLLNATFNARKKLLSFDSFVSSIATLNIGSQSTYSYCPRKLEFTGMDSLLIQSNNKMLAFVSFNC